MCELCSINTFRPPPKSIFAGYFRGCVRHILALVPVTVALTLTATVLSAEPGLSDLQKQWALATTAIRTSQNGDLHDILGGQENTAESVRSATRLLHDSWSIDSREDLLTALESLARVG